LPIGPHPLAKGLICWLWIYQQEQVLVVINFSDTDAAFALADELHLLHLKNPVSLLDGNQPHIAHQIHELASWGVYVWKVEQI
jgi:hypothetical protein